MSLPVTPLPSPHKDFVDANADVTLISRDSVAFDVASSYLSRTSDWFRAMFELPASPKAAKQSTWRIQLDEDALTLEILLKIALGLAPQLERLDTLNAIDRVLLAAEKYDMPAAREFVGFKLRDPVKEDQLLRLYAIATHHGFKETATEAFNRLLTTRIAYDSCATVPGPALARLVAARQRRVAYFTPEFRATDDDERLIHELNSHQATCEMCNCAADPSLYTDWHAFQALMIALYVDEPCVTTILYRPDANTALHRVLKARCPSQTCSARVIEWGGFRIDLAECEASVPEEGDTTHP